MITTRSPNVVLFWDSLRIMVNDLTAQEASGNTKVLTLNYTMTTGASTAYLARLLDRA